MAHGGGHVRVGTAAAAINPLRHGQGQKLHKGGPDALGGVPAQSLTVIEEDNFAVLIVLVRKELPHGGIVRGKVEPGVGVFLQTGFQHPAEQLRGALPDAYAVVGAADVQAEADVTTRFVVPA